MLTEKDMHYVRHLAKKLTDQIGFLPTMQYDRARREGRLLLQYENSEPCGFLIHGTTRPGEPCIIYQAAIQTDAQRRKHATVLVLTVEMVATKADCTEIRIRCAADLEAIAFWLSIGYSERARTPGGKRRGRIIVTLSHELRGHQGALWLPD